ncbi:dolichol-phosphate mannosyltransferase in lipid-linked oligosaccharide synthesis cluster [Gracilibacillus boraciitolerans JCM 21714]|uniref:Beta-monoglucosyldiacylglycerol synthase n=1 Tax=Gracilibacillus boraciitolerans JCM 21714 TaxID=1298598 RepID=W4VP02_9BACI|nr:dolichol-phosphate mannosyltransferase in lipid-linked oligosaccharide synthesis cluster [Gracilibacillus boraciitolerans JCM 21714]
MQGGNLLSRQFKETAKQWQQNVPYYPTVSILIPAHNEEMVIEDTLEAMSNLTYPTEQLQVLVINDNSNDRTGEICEAYGKRFPFIEVIHTKPPNGGKGKSAALNNGLAHTTGEIICVYDADNTPEPDAIYWLVLGLVNDPKAGAVVGKFRVLNANKNFLTRLINIETLTFQWLAQAGRWFWFKLATIPGTNFAVRKSILEELNGWDEGALSEDTELSFRIYDLGYHIRFFPNAITWEQEPETLKVWWRQRTRWARGNLYVIFKFFFHFFKLKHKRVGLDLIYFMFTYVFFFGGVILSHSLFLASLIFDVQLSVGFVSYLLLISGFLLFIIEELLALSFEKDQLTKKNVLTVILMYFTYSQMWLFLVVYAAFIEVKRVLLKQEVTWYKTKRFSQKDAKNKKTA